MKLKRGRDMTNAEALIQGLQKIDEGDIAEQVSDYISCPSSSECGYNGSKDNSHCTPCKIKWLRAEWEY